MAIEPGAAASKSLCEEPDDRPGRVHAGAACRVPQADRHSLSRREAAPKPPQHRQS